MLNLLLIATHLFIASCYLTIAVVIYREVKPNQQNLNLLKNPLVLITAALLAILGLREAAEAVLGILFGQAYPNPVLFGVQEGFALAIAVVTAMYWSLRRQDSILVESLGGLLQTPVELGKMTPNLESAEVAQDSSLAHQLRQELQRQQLRSQLFSQVALKIRQSFQIEEILETTVKEVRQLFQTDRVLIFRLRPDGSGTVINEAVAPDFPVILTQSIADPCFGEKYLKLYRQGRVRVIPDVHNSDLEQCHIKLLQSFSVQANLVVPILQGESLWGLLIAQQCTNPRQWSEFEIELMKQLADQLAIALTQAASLEALRESEKKYRSVVDNVKEVIFQTDLSGCWTFLNPAWEEITGFSASESLGESLLNYIYPEDRQTVTDLGLWIWDYSAEAKEKVLPKTSYCRREIRYQTKSKEIRWVELNAQLTLASDDSIIGTSGTLNDITERKQAEEKVQQALEKEKELNELKSRFVSMTSHEFRTPLSTILSSSELLQHYSYRWTEEKKLAHFKRIYASVQQMTQLLNDVLIIGKVEAGKLEFQPAPVDLSQFCQALVEELQLADRNRDRLGFIEQDHILLGESHHLDVRQGSALGIPTSILTPKFSSLPRLDERLLRHILSNLLSNALKYSHPESKVYLELACTERDAIFKIQDSGIGIPEEDRERLFESFHRATNVGNISGTGLGLAIVKRCVDLHGGTIAFHSQVGVGTTFTVSLPLNNNILTDDQDFSH